MQDRKEEKSMWGRKDREIGRKGGGVEGERGRYGIGERRVEDERGRRRRGEGEEV